MIKISIDRLAQMYKYEVPDSIEESEYAQLVISVWVDNIRKIVATHAPSDVHITSSGNAYAVQFYYETLGELPEPMFNISIQQYVNGVRLDFNPKRMRMKNFGWLQNIMNDIKYFAHNGGYHSHTTQIDLAIDMFDEGTTAANFKINKMGVKRTGLFNAVNGDKETEYYGVRGSNSYLRIYNKTNEQISILSKKYRRLKAVAFKRYEDMRAEINADNLTSDDVIEEFKEFDFEASPFSDRDFTKQDEFESALNWSLSELRLQEQNQIPADWRRMEIVLRTEKLSNDRVTFDDDVVYEYIDSIINTDLATISDYHFRALALAVADGSVQVSELTANERSRYRKIMKNDEIVVFKTLSSGQQRVMGLADFNAKIDPAKVTYEKHITKKSDKYLQKKVRDAFDLCKNDLKLELMSYTI